MSIKKHLLNALLHDLTVCQHLYTKLDSSNAEWRPQENMRTTLELMQYLALIGKASINSFIDPTFKLNRDLLTNLAPDITFENFPEKIEEEKLAITKAFTTITDEDLTNRMTKLPMSPNEVPLIDGILSSIKFLAAYRHQLFLYAKLQGAEIGTANNWRGQDMPQPQPVAA